jgi:RNA polymerase sigma-70 factor (ECF subfamily)
LEADYPSLIRRLARVLRSHDKASDALHDAYLKLSGAPAIGEIRNPLAYLHRMALNLAHNVRLRDARVASASPEIIQNLPDDTPDPERIALARRDVDKLLAMLATLPEQRRNIFLARWRDDLTQQEIAGRCGVHKRTVQKELAKAERFLRASAMTAD